MRKRRSFTLEFKTQVVFELLREEKELNQIATEHDIAPNMLRAWKKEFLANASNAFSNKKEDSYEQEKVAYEEKIEQLYNTIGQLTVDVIWLKKLNKLLDLAGKKELATKDDSKLSVRRQCKLLNINRSSVYYKERAESNQEVAFKHMMDQIHTDPPS